MDINTFWYNISVISWWQFLLVDRLFFWCLT